MPDSPTVSGEIDTSGLYRSGQHDAVRLPVRLGSNDDTLVRPRAWPRATRELTSENPRSAAVPTEQLRDKVWFAIGGLLIVVGLYLVF